MTSLPDFPTVLLPIIDSYLPLGGRNEFRLATERPPLSDLQLQSMAESEAIEMRQIRLDALRNNIQINRARADQCERRELAEKVAQCQRVLDSYPKSVESLKEKLTQIFATLQESSTSKEIATRDAIELSQVERTTPYSFMVSHYFNQLSEDSEQWNVRGLIDGLHVFSNVLHVLDIDSLSTLLFSILGKAFLHQNIEVIEAVFKTYGSIRYSFQPLQERTGALIEIAMNNGHLEFLKKVLDLDFKVITERQFYKLILDTSFDNLPLSEIFLRSKQWDLLKDLIATNRLDSMMSNLEDSPLKAIVETVRSSRY